MAKNRKKAAAVTAVLHYLQEEEAAIVLAAQAQGTAAPVSVSPPPQPVKLWAVSGRQAQMEMRTLMQMKAFHRP